MRALACALLSFCACSENGSGAGCAGDPSVEPGSAVYDDPEIFVPLEDSDEVTLVFGGQGGFHLWQSLRARGVAPRCNVGRRVERAADGLVLFDNAPGDTFDLAASEGACLLPVAQPSFVSAADARDQDVFLEVSVDDGATTATGRVRVHVTCPPMGTEEGEYCRTE